MTSVVWPTLIDTLIAIEGVSHDDSGVFSFPETNGPGGVFVERGRICWAAAPGMQRRLTDLLKTCAIDHDLDLDRIFERCRAEGRLLGQTLVDEGWIAPRELETALRRHSAESLVALCCHEPGGVLWSSRGHRGYGARFSFRPIDVLFDVVALQLPHQQHAARVGLAEVDAPDRRGGAFYFESHRDMAVPVAAFGDVNVQSLRTLGQWALSLPRATLELAASPSFALAATARGDAIMVWWRGTLLYAVACDDRRGLAAVMGHHLRLAEGGRTQ